MKRGWLLLLMLSLGLNAGLLIAFFSGRAASGKSDQARVEPAGLVCCPGGTPCPPNCPALVDSLSNQRVARIGRFLDLDRSQMDGFTRLRQQNLPEILQIRDEVRGLRRTIHEEYRRPVVDSHEVRRLVSRLAATQGRLDSLASETMLGEAALLSPAQRERYFESLRWGAELRLPPGPGDCPPAPPGPGH